MLGFIFIDILLFDIENKILVFKDVLLYLVLFMFVIGVIVIVLMICIIRCFVIDVKYCFYIVVVIFRGFLSW